MKRTSLTLLLAATSLLGLAAVPAQANTGQAVIFSVDYQPLDVRNNPTGCQGLPTTAHVLNNQTDGPLYLYGNPWCVGPAIALAPGTGAHVPAGIGSFSDH
ncbi:hypothetical protein [Kitasatospora sp. LaBMicrA B282]|uniref:hypothetical protein n=1 Tax=Kitasatospora sp. LaBMicrA B282 TaxID=3420949 RepID=UPI003D114366